MEEFHPIPPSPTQLPKVIWRLIQPVFDTYRVTFRRGFGHAQYHSPSIVCYLSSRRPGGKTGEVYKPRLRASTVTTDGRSVLEYWGKGFTCTYHFDVVSSNPDEADTLLDNLEDMLDAIAPDLQRRGVHEWYMLEHTGPRLIEARGEQLYVHTLVYEAILDKVRRRVVPIISAVSVKVGQSGRIETDIEMTHQGIKDEINRRNIVKVIYASDVPRLWETWHGVAEEIPLDTRIYVPGVDFVPEFAPDLSKTVLLWTDAGRRPTTGATYYVTCEVLE